MDAVRATYGEAAARLRFLDGAEAEAATRERSAILERIGERAHTSSRGTKLHAGALSPGCATCVSGAWSCLFVNSSCNLRCFYCPTPQQSVGVPATNSITFPRPRDYVDYLRTFGFRGASMSGGEPLLTLDKTLGYILAIKQRFGAEMHVWLYTNGTLLDADVVARLRQAGLDEIRFDIGATSYRLDKVALAVGAIPRVTVEVPAIPDDMSKMKQRLADMEKLGVDHLNLHQLRLTPHNLPKLVERDYTFVLGEAVTVLESEQAALQLIEHALDAGIQLPINYCSFPYKRRFQRAAARRRSASKVRYGYESVTESGLLRQLTLVAPPAVMAERVERLRRSGLPREAWSAATGRLHFAPEAWDVVAPGAERVVVSHFGTHIVEAPSYRARSFEVELNRRRTIYVEKIAYGEPVELIGEDVAALARLLAGEDPTAFPHSPGISTVLSREQIESGLVDYS